MTDAPTLEHVFTLTVQLADVIDIGDTARGRRRVIPITGGTVEGPLLQGVVLAGGADAQFIRADGVTELDARYVIQSTGGDRVYIENTGLRTASADDVARLTRGEPVDPAMVYFRTTPRFETAAPDLQWLTSTLFVAVGERDPDAVRIVVYAVR